MSLARIARSSVLTLALVLSGSGCSEVKDVTVPVGSLRMFPIDTALQQPTLEEARTQVAVWRISAAHLGLAGRDIDMLFGQTDCRFFDSIVSSPSGKGTCGTGVVVGEIDTPESATLDLTLTMTVSRMAPLDLPPGGDYDMDGVPNDTDICPLIADPGQEDSNGDGIGDACTVKSPFEAGVWLHDSDADGVADDFDNCLYVSNALQEDTAGPASDIPGPDGIGDACTTETATVLSGGAAEIQLSLTPDAPFTLTANNVSFYVVNFGGDGALTCDWTAGTCALDPALLKVCVRDTASGAVLGCN